MKYKIRIRTFNEIGNITEVYKTHPCKEWSVYKKQMMGKIYIATNNLESSCANYYMVYTLSNCKLCFYKDFVEVLEKIYE